MTTELNFFPGHFAVNFKFLSIFINHQKHLEKRFILMISHRLVIDGTSKDLVNFYGVNLMSGFREIEFRKNLL